MPHIQGVVERAMKIGQKPELPGRIARRQGSAKQPKVPPAAAEGCERRSCVGRRCARHVFVRSPGLEPPAAAPAILMQARSRQCAQPLPMARSRSTRKPLPTKCCPTPRKCCPAHAGLIGVSPHRLQSRTLALSCHWNKPLLWSSSSSRRCLRHLLANGCAGAGTQQLACAKQLHAFLKPWNRAPLARCCAGCAAEAPARHRQ